MTFNTQAPFFPYREPSDQRASSQGNTERLLRVYTFSTAGRMAGTLGKAGVWPGVASYAKPADGIVLGAITQAIPDYAAPPNSGWLTRFDDTSSPRPGTDEVYFAAAPSLGELTPPPNVIVIPHPVRIPVDLIALVLFAGGVAMVAMRRLRRT
jgi:hypothetical protein